MQAGMFSQKLKSARSFCAKTRKFTAHACREAREASLVICHDTSSAFPAAVAAFRARAPIALDVSEIPDLLERTSSYFRVLPSGLTRLLHLFDKLVGRRSVVVTASSTGFCDYASARYKRPVLQVTNYDSWNVASSSQRRSDGIVTIGWPSSFSRQTGAELALRALQSAPENWRLCVCDAEPDLSDDIALGQMLAACRSNVRFLGRKPYVEYMQQLRECSVGWVLFDSGSRNLRSCLPNRFLDLVAAGVPIVSTPNESIQPILAGTGWGECIAYGDDRALVQATAGILGTVYSPPSQEEFQTRAQAVSFEDAYAGITVDVADKGRPLAAIVAMRNLSSRRRITLLAYALVKLGWRVVVICRHEGPDIAAERPEALHIQVKPHFPSTK